MPKRFHQADDQWLSHVEKAKPFGHLLNPQEVAEVTAFLMSDRAGLTTGSIVDFDQSVQGTSS